MRFKKVIIISFLLIAILTLSAVSASENVTDSINEANDEANLELDYPDETYDPDDNKWDINLEEDCFTYGLDNHLKVYTPTIDKDRVEFSIDDDNSYEFKYNSTDDSFNTDISNLDLGEHIFVASYRGALLSS